MHYIYVDIVILVYTQNICILFWAYLNLSIKIKEEGKNMIMEVENKVYLYKVYSVCSHSKIL